MQGTCFHLQIHYHKQTAPPKETSVVADTVLSIAWWFSGINCFMQKLVYTYIDLKSKTNQINLAGHSHNGA